MTIVQLKVGKDVHDDGRKMTKKELDERPGYYFIGTGDFGLVWLNIGIFVVGHILYAYAFYVMYRDTPWATWFFTLALGYWVGLSIGGGAHRLWAHRSYEAALPLKLFLMIGQSIAGQNCVYIWCRDHRVHHKWSDTDGDPHNTRRGYFFAHVGWLLRKKHPEMKIKAKTLDFSDLLADPIVKFQNDHYWIIYLIFSLYLPIAVPVFVWGEEWWRSFLFCYIARYMTTLHCTWFVNSTAHMFGAKPYNRHIAPVENALVSFGTFGEGYHNYHHTFPWDYRASELGYSLNVTKKFIDKMASYGQAYNLKFASRKIIESTKDKMTKFELPNGQGHSHIEVPFTEANNGGA